MPLRSRHDSEKRTAWKNTATLRFSQIARKKSSTPAGHHELSIVAKRSLVTVHWDEKIPRETSRLG
jgi:hypothetical protein